MDHEKVTAFPLCWPDGWRTMPANERKRAQFNRKGQRTTVYGSYTTTNQLSVFDAIGRVLSTLEKIGVDIVDDVVISTNLKTRLDGLPRSNQPEPNNPAAACYWITTNGDRRCMAIDRYDRVADNIAAIAATLEAMRAIERHGGAEILDRAFTGFTALPSPAQWWHVLGFETSAGLSPEEVEERYRKLAMQRHPDRGGSSDSMAELSWAREKARDHFGRAA